eukprot:scaffold84657_cov53-Attheya_sp.AAC.1
MSGTTPVVPPIPAVPLGAVLTPLTTQPAAPVVFIIKPTKPIMGDRAELKTDLFVLWMGGKPTSDWKGLSSSARVEYESLNQLRSTYASDAQKSYKRPSLRWVAISPSSRPLSGITSKTLGWTPLPIFRTQEI